MTKTTDQRRTAASVLKVIEGHLEQELHHLREAQARVEYRLTKVNAIREVLKGCALMGAVEDADNLSEKNKEDQND